MALSGANDKYVPWLGAERIEQTSETFQRVLDSECRAASSIFCYFVSAELHVIVIAIDHTELPISSQCTCRAPYNR